MGLCPVLGPNPEQDELSGILLDGNNRRLPFHVIFSSQPARGIYVGIWKTRTILTFCELKPSRTWKKGEFM